MLLTREVSAQGNRNMTSPMQGPLFGILMPHSELESHFYCTVTSAKCVHKTLHKDASRERSQGQSECLSQDLRVYYKLVGWVICNKTPLNDHGQNNSLLSCAPRVKKKFLKEDRQKAISFKQKNIYTFSVLKLISFSDVLTVMYSKGYNKSLTTEFIGYK